MFSKLTWRLPPLSSFNINDPPVSPPVDSTIHVIQPIVASDGSSQPLPCRFVDGSSPRDPNDCLCVDSGTTFSMSGVRSDFLSLEPVVDQWIEMANGERIAVEGRGPVSLLLGGKIVQEADWLFVPSLAM